MALVMQSVKVLSFIPVTDELMMDGGWTKAYPTWADAESTPMWRFEDESVLVPPKPFDFVWSERAAGPAFDDDDPWLDDDDDEDDDEDAA